MGKPTGFLEYKRELFPERDPLERIHDWDEFHLSLDKGKLAKQAARCMDCGIPFCHSGIMLNGMVSGCPVNNLIPDWNDLVYKDLWEEALYCLLKTNNFPEFTGRVCPAPCEGACVLGISDPPVTIKNIELAIVEHAFAKGITVPAPPSYRTGKKIAVVGSGPAGLACASQLNSVGHHVTVFERDDRPGGLLMYGIPNMKLDKKIVMRRIESMSAEGIEFVLNAEVGTDYPVNNLVDEYDALILCCGATRPRDLAVEGRDLSGVCYAMDFLRSNTRSLIDSGLKDDKFISAAEKDVVIIGGGDTGTDCVATAIRHGCNSVLQLEILPSPPAEREKNNPWPQWPKIFRSDYAQREAFNIFGHDPRQFSIMTTKCEGDASGNVKYIHTVKVEWSKSSENRFLPVPIPGTEKIYSADLVVLAMGFVGAEDTLPNQLGIGVSETCKVKAEYGKFYTGVDGVFVAGDMRRGQSLVVWAINEGRGAARECDRYLMGESTLL